MAERLPAEALIHFLSNFSWSASAIPNGLPAELELLLHNFHAQRQLQLQIPQILAAMQMPPAPPATPSPASATSSSPARSSPRRDSRMTSPGQAYDCIRNTYSDCEKRHFLDVAYENNWGTTVAANKFTRIWGKGPSRRMFYWWREQFKKEHDREQKILEDLRTRKAELKVQLAEMAMDARRMVERVQQCAHQIDVVDTEIAVLLSKRQKAFCSITGEPCMHGDGLQEEGTVIRKFTTPFNCDFCKMPFQKEKTCYIHMRLCQSRYIGPTQPVPVRDTSNDFIVVQHANNTYSELTEFAEHMLNQIAAATPQPQTIQS